MAEVSYLTDDEINWSFDLTDERLAALPLVSTHNEPQVAPQEYECGCVTVTRITDREYRHDERPFEMRLARACGAPTCERERSAREASTSIEVGGVGGAD